jgi:predicted metal-binding membrane protein
LINLLRRDRAVVLLALAGVTMIAWLYLLIARQNMDMAMGEMPGMPEMAMPFAAPWVFAMWWVMMLGMMLPSAAPMILTFNALQRRKRQRADRHVPTVLFVGGYLLVWGLFSVVATVAQWALQRYALLSPALAVASSAFGGVLFILAGVYQFTPLKHACLSHCRSPLPSC